MVAQFAAIGSGIGVAGIFLRPMTEDLGWTSAEYTFGGAAAYVVGGLVGFLIGPFVDRYGARPLMLVGACIYGISFLGISRTDVLWQFVLLSMLAGGVAFSMVGQLVVNVTLSKWFVVKRGWAIALGSSGISLVSLIMPITMTRVVDAMGWRDAYVVLAVSMFAILVPVALVMRRGPKTTGCCRMAPHQVLKVGGQARLSRRRLAMRPTPTPVVRRCERPPSGYLSWVTGST